MSSPAVTGARESMGRNMRLSAALMVLVMVVAVAPLTWAQDEGSQGSEGPLGDSLEDYWSERRDIRVIEHRQFEKVGRHQLTAYVGIIPNDPFINYYPLGIRYDYWLLESVGLEVDASYIGDTFRAESDLQGFLEENGADVVLLDQQRWRTHFGVNWAPFYGKIAFLNLKLIHFDFNVFGGIGVVGVRSLNAERTAEEDEYKVEGSIGCGLNIWVIDWFSIRIDFRQFIFEKAGGGASHPSEISLGFSFFI